MKFIAKGKVRISYYGDQSKEEEFFHIVNANDFIQAENKVRDFYKSKNEEFYSSYWVEEIEIFEEIE